MEDDSTYDYDKNIEIIKKDDSFTDSGKAQIIDLILRAKALNVLPIDIMKMDHQAQRMHGLKEAPQKIVFSTSSINKHTYHDLVSMAQMEQLSNDFYRHDDDYLVSKMYVYDKNADLLITGTTTIINFEMLLKEIDKNLNYIHEDITKKGFLTSIDYAKEYCAFPVYSIYLVSITQEQFEKIIIIIKKYPSIIVKVDYCFY